MNVRNMLLENWGIKLVSLVFAITLWFYVTSKGKTEMTLTVPLELRNTPRHMAVVGNVTGVVEVRVQGQERVLRDGSAGKKVIGIVDLSLAKEGENTVRISPADIKRPGGIVVTNITPSEMKVKLEPLVRKTFRLQPLLHGNPARGYRIAGIKSVPTKIAVEGAASAMAEFDKLQTMPIDIQGVTHTIIVEPKIDYLGQPVKILEDHISVQVFIERVKK